TSACIDVVYVGAVRAQVTSASSSSLTVAVPVDAIYAPITVAVNGSVAIANAAFQPTFVGNGSPISAQTFAPRQDLTGGDGNHRTVIADLDGDGKPDLAVANVYAHTISLFRNIGAPGALSSA